MSRLNAEAIAARARLAGAAVPLPEYVNHVPRSAAAESVLAQLRALHPEVPPETALAVLVEARGWRDQVFHRHLLPRLTQALAAGDDLVPLADPWLAKPLCLPTPGQVCALARTCPTANWDQVLALIVLFDRLRGVVVSVPPPLAPAPDEVLLVARALPHWAGPALIPVVLSGLNPAIGAGRVADYIRLLRQSAWAVARAGGRIEDLRRGVAAQLAATAPPGHPCRGTFLYELAVHHREVSEALGLPATRESCGIWYRDAAGQVEADFPECRGDWVSDILGGWTGGGCGRFLIPSLFGVWAGKRRAGQGSPGPPGPLLRARDQLGVGVGPLLWPVLGVEVMAAASGRSAARLARDAVLVAGEALSDRVRAVILGRVLGDPPDPAADRDGLTAWAQVSVATYAAVGRAAAALGQKLTAPISVLLWESLLSGPARRPGLRARLGRWRNVADAQPAHAAWVGELHSIL